MPRIGWPVLWGALFGLLVFGMGVLPDPEPPDAPPYVFHACAVGGALVMGGSLAPAFSRKDWARRAAGASHILGAAMLLFIVGVGLALEGFYPAALIPPVFSLPHILAALFYRSADVRARFSP